MLHAAPASAADPPASLVFVDYRAAINETGATINPASFLTNVDPAEFPLAAPSILENVPAEAGAATVNAFGIRYEPAVDYIGNASYRYRACLAAHPTVCGTGTVFFRVSLSTQVDFVSLPPTRVLDTRNGLGVGNAAPVGSEGEILLPLAGRGGLPALADVEAVALNVTTTNSTEPSFVTVYPSEASRPNASNLNTEPGTDVANSVIVKLGADGAVRLFNNRGTVDLVADVVGYFPSISFFEPTAPVRVLDTRNGTGVAAAGPISRRSDIRVQIAGLHDLPSSGVAVAVLNVTSTQSTADSFVSVWPSGQPRPNISSLNTEPGTDVPNLVWALIGDDGAIRIYNDEGDVHIAADLLGWFPVNSEFSPLPPTRILDTRTGVGSSTDTPLGPRTRRDLSVRGRAVIPSSGVDSLILNVTSTESNLSSYVTVYPEGVATPNASSLNTEPGTNVANNVIVKIGDDGEIVFYNNEGDVHLIADVIAYFPS